MFLFTLSATLDHTQFNIWKDKLSPDASDKGEQSSRRSPAVGTGQLPLELQALKGQLWYV